VNRPPYLFAAVLLGSQFVGAQGAQPAHDYSLTVDLDVTADNPALKSEIQSDFLQEIRALDRSVTITTVHPTYRLRVAAISIGDRDAPKADFAVSYIYSVLEKVPNSVIGAYRELRLGDLAMLSGANGDERMVCRKIAAAFDAAVLIDARAMREAIRRVQEGKK
jgi:hypothetical protein